MSNPFSNTDTKAMIFDMSWNPLWVQPPKDKALHDKEWVAFESKILILNFGIHWAFGS